MTQGRKGMYLFLVDRRKTKKAWWTYDCDEAMRFEKKEAALTQARKLRYKSPEVISFETAKKLSKENDRRYDYDALEHPFSSEALGQE